MRLKFHLESNEQLRNKTALMQEGMFASEPGQPKQITCIGRPRFEYRRGQAEFLTKVGHTNTKAANLALRMQTFRDQKDMYGDYGKGRSMQQGFRDFDGNYKGRQPFTCNFKPTKKKALPKVKRQTPTNVNSRWLRQNQNADGNGDGFKRWDDDDFAGADGDRPPTQRSGYNNNESGDLPPKLRLQLSIPGASPQAVQRRRHSAQRRPQQRPASPGL